MLTWSLGWAPSPARLAITSLAFMFEEVPEPVWKTSIGNWSSCSPAATASPAAAIRSARSASSSAELAVDLGRGGLEPAQPADDGHRHPLAGDGEVVDGLGGLATPELLSQVCPPSKYRRATEANASLALDAVPADQPVRREPDDPVRRGAEGAIAT